MRCYDNGQLVATANNSGSIFLLEFSKNLATSAKNDKALLTAVCIFPKIFKFLVFAKIILGIQLCIAYIKKINT